jgi:hypothetical protein
MATDIKKLTQPEIADAWAKFTVKAWQDKISKLKIGSSGQLMDSFVRNVVMGAQGDVVKIQFAFRYYGRFVDMGVGKGVKIGGVRTNATSRRLEGKMLGNRRHPEKWYSKTLRHEQLRLIELLAEYYSQSAIEMIVSNFVQVIE